jgi:hypothetical protein
MENKTCKQCNEIKDKNEFSGRSLRCKYCTNQNSIKQKIEKAILEGKEYKYKPILEYDVNRTSKICTKCEEEKIISEFYINKKSKDGHTARCIKCMCRKKILPLEDTTSKICNTCNIRKKLIEFSKGDCKLGVRNRCKECEKPLKKKYSDVRIKNMSEEDKLKYKEYHTKYREENKITIREKIKEYNIKNRNVISKKYNIYIKNRFNVDSLFKLTFNIRTLIRNSFYCNGYTKKSKTQEILGCSFEEFKLHLESKFESWMTWENRGLYNGELNYGWDLDHIIPISSANTEEDITKLNHYTNFQPLCSFINRNIKRDKLEY